MDLQKNIDELLEPAQKKDVVAVGRLFDFLVEPVFRFVFFRVKNRENAEDLTNEILLKIFENLPKFEKQKNVPFLAWVFRIAKNKITDFWRTRREIFEIDENKIDKDSTENLQRETENFFDRRRLKIALQKLPENQREAVSLKFFAQLQTAEIAATMRKSPTAVRVLLSRGLKKLKIILAE